MEMEQDVAEIEAEYTLEMPVKCSHCQDDFETIQVIRLLRTKTNFTSTLPRRGYMIICPNCHTSIAAGLGTRMALV